MSGVYKPMIVGFGFAAAVISIYAVRRMDVADGYRFTISLNPIKLVGYTVWLFGEIAKSNIAVTRLILSPNMKLRQYIFHTPNTQKTELAAVMFANSITLTPGTITVETQDDGFWVHALNYDASDHAALADMDVRASAVETGSA